MQPNDKILYLSVGVVLDRLIFKPMRLIKPVIMFFIGFLIGLFWHDNVLVKLFEVFQ